MDEVAINVFELESLAARLEGRFDPVRTMIVVPQLRGDKYVFPLNCPWLDHLLHGVADRLFIAVAFRTVEVSKSHFQCGLGCLLRGEGVGDQRAKSEGGDRARSVREGNPGVAQGVGGCHACFPPSGWALGKFKDR